MKVLVSDFDDTLFTKDYIKNIKKINEFVNNGNMFIIATGRNLNQLLKDIEGRNINFSYLICNDGGTIFDKDLNLVSRIDIDPQIAEYLLEELNNDNNISKVLVDNGFHYFEHTDVLNNALIGRYIDKDKAQTRIDELMSKYDNINAYLSHNWINIGNKKISKGNAIKYLEELLNLNKNHIYTVGDNINDISMNEMFNGYYIENNSQPELIEVSIGSAKSVKELIIKIEKMTT
ncbi:MAG: HAD-IIB family hydrolase [Bacilli bacterium]|nr:HAD-IIB family hydrolase [Bacilli bacterium]